MPELRQAKSLNFYRSIDKTNIRTFLQALCLYFYYDEWNGGIMIPIKIALIKDDSNYCC